MGSLRTSQGPSKGKGQCRSGDGEGEAEEEEGQFSAVRWIHRRLELKQILNHLIVFFPPIFIELDTHIKL